MIDLHTHSNYSDGTCSPTQLIRLAQSASLTAVALCDHNTVGGLAEFRAAACGSGVEAVPGIEFSTDYGAAELHILGLWIRPEQEKAVDELLRQAQERKEQSNRALVAALARAGVRLDYDRLKAHRAGGTVNRAVIAAEMTRLGYTGSVEEAFSCWLAPERGYFRPPRRLDCFEVICFIRSLGAVSVLAHPFLNLEQRQLREFLPLAVEAGLDGMETLYPKFDPHMTCMAREIAQEFGLLESGGSDFHGENKPDTHIGIGAGSLAVPDRMLDGLKGRLRQNSAL